MYFVIMSYYSLLRVILNENKETKKLNNLSSNYQRLLHKQQAKDLDEYIPSLVAQKIVSEGALPLTEDVQNFLRGTTEYANDIQSDIDLFVTKSRFKEASIRHKVDPIVKSVWRTENPLALLFKDVAKLDAKTPIIGSLLRETDLAKKVKNSDLIKKQLEKAPDIDDTILIHRFKKFKDDPVTFNSSKDNNDNDDNNKVNYPGLAPPAYTADDFQDLPNILFQLPPETSTQSTFNQSQPNLYNKPIFSQLQQPKNAFDRVGNAPIAPGEQIMCKIECIVEKTKHEE